MSTLAVPQTDAVGGLCWAYYRSRASRRVYRIHKETGLVQFKTEFGSWIDSMLQAKFIWQDSDEISREEAAR